MHEIERHFLTPLFAPRSVAVIGASERPGSPGRVVFENLLKGGYDGDFFPVNPNHKKILGRHCYATIEDIDRKIELAVVITPARTIPALIDAIARKGIKHALIISGGFSDGGPGGAGLTRQLVTHARSFGVRFLGPGCLGVMRPVDKLNLTYNTIHAKPGRIALISQSGALTNAMLDWAHANDVGFSSVIALGDGADITFGDVLDYLVWDNDSDSIMLYMEGVYDPRRFVSALRAAARVKPVIVVKTGREAAAYKAAVTHSGSMVGSDEVFDSVLRRAGAVRVRTFTQLFTAARCLTSRYRSCGNRLAIVTNGGGPGIISADWAVEHGVEVPDLPQPIVETLNQALLANWSRANPLDLCGTAGPGHYQAAVTSCLESDQFDGVLVILTPQVMTDVDGITRELIELAHKHSKPVLACWMGESQVAGARQMFAAAHIPVFRTPEPAVEAFAGMYHYLMNQRMLLQVPYSVSYSRAPDSEGAAMLIKGILSEKRKALSEMESKALLAAFQIPVARTTVARSVSEALMIAEQTGFPVAMKVNSPDISHKSDVGGVRLNIRNAPEVRTAYQEILQRVAAACPEAKLDGVSIQPMTIKPNGRELMVGITTDSVFGPVITFGAGGLMVDVMRDRSVALPPLNPFICRDLMARTKARRMLKEFRSMPPINTDALEAVLMRVSEMASELPWIRELDINPLIVDEEGAIAVDARVIVDYPALHRSGRYAHMAIHPYPTSLVQGWQLSDGTEVTIRPVRPEDAEMLQDFVRGLSEESKYFRFISTMQELSKKLLVRFTQIDYDREMALVATVMEQGVEIELGASRYSINPDGESCEFALVVGDRWHNRGIGSKLMHALFEVARARGLKTMEGDVLNNNHNMLRLMTALGFTLANHPEDPSMKRVVRPL